MGITYCDAMMLWNARKRGNIFGKILTIGHQSLYLHRGEVAFFRKEYREAFRVPTSPLDNYRWADYCDDFLIEFLGASLVTALDASDYEGADRIHDMNDPVPESWHGQYDTVIDSGSLEHIFNIPVAFANIGTLLREGGKVFITTPANNQMGHGFYQFSPDLMFRVFSEQNGFSLRNIYLFEGKYPNVEFTKNHTVYRVTDPQQADGRIGVISNRPVTMMVEATKERDGTMFVNPPIQSDYVKMWNVEAGLPARASTSDLFDRARSIMKRILHAFPICVWAPIEGIHQKRKLALANRDFYERENWSPRSVQKIESHGNIIHA